MTPDSAVSSSATAAAQGPRGTIPRRGPRSPRSLLASPGVMAEGSRCLNVNVGVLGHVDSGKTSLVASLSSILSTAALDKNPQSQARGITLDLGFSAFKVPLPQHVSHLPFDNLQFTLVDCPGHASLIRTIIGGANIMDIMILVVDITKGIQVQTAECLVIGEVTAQQMLVVLNKIDLLPAETRDRAINKLKKRLAKTLKLTKFWDCKMIPVAAKPGGNNPAVGVEELASELTAMVQGPPVRRSGPFLFAIDHCFPIKGHGTILTGTVLQGELSVNNVLEIPHLKEKRKVKSMQMFKQNALKIQGGDRAGVCVTNLDPAKIERGLAAAPGTVPTFQGAIAWVDKIRFYSGSVKSKSKFHVTVGHSTVMATVRFFSTVAGAMGSEEEAVNALLQRLSHLSLKKPSDKFCFENEYLHEEVLHGPCEEAASSSGQPKYFGQQWALLQFDVPLTAPKDAVLIGARLDTDVQCASCRLAFYGQLVAPIDLSNPDEAAKLKVFKWKEKTGVIDRVQPDGKTAICRNLLKKGTDLRAFMGLKVVAGNGSPGVLESTFGTTGKVKVFFQAGLGRNWQEDKTVKLVFKRFQFGADKKRIVQ
ncbi:unnamed protein product [Ostreobium quekettii]|uniref:Selenocysteine-specific elongation factor n=1 Tax=Ostreobium quekettii TaxID=121088 RepID=A0A8S1J066_9CHLO|nr:unnamed protein product [Ostreobium quekettii]|eukprot:evm.model.scf_576.3 EVM.evm.TU.scf_576.3   scf_576:10690-19510(-)